MIEYFFVIINPFSSSIFQFEQMELEIREIESPSEQDRNTSQLRSFKAECKRLQAEFSTARLKHQRRTERGELLGGGGGRHLSTDSDAANAAASDGLTSDNKAHRQRYLPLDFE